MNIEKKRFKQDEKKKQQLENDKKSGGFMIKRLSAFTKLKESARLTIRFSHYVLHRHQ